MGVPPPPGSKGREPRPPPRRPRRRLLPPFLPLVNINLPTKTILGLFLTSRPSMSASTAGWQKKRYSAAAQHSEVASSPGSASRTRADTTPHSIR